MADLNTKIRGAQIKDGTITASELATDAVETLKIKDLNVTTGKLAADAVDSTKLADNAVDSEHITAGAVDNAHLAGNIALTKLVSGTDAQVIVADVSGVPTYVDITGDVTIIRIRMRSSRLNLLR